MKLVSVILINFNGVEDLEACLRSLFLQDYEQIELCLIDNRSMDGSPEALREFAYDSESRRRFWGDSPLLILNEQNVGFSLALNQGIKASAGEVIVPLNPDVVLERGFISSIVAPLAEPDVGSVTGKLLRFPPGGKDNVVDSVGHQIFRNRLAKDRGEGEPGATSFLERETIFGTCGAAAAYSRRMLDDVAVDGEYFDEDFFAFWEDLDLDWRANLRGWRCIYEPAAIAYHRRGGTGYRKTLLVEYHNYKNRYLMIIKNDSVLYLLRNLPGILVTEVLKGGALLLRCPRALLSLLEVARLMPSMLRKRREIQSRRIVPAREIEEMLDPFSYRDWMKRHFIHRGEMIAGAGRERP